MKIKETLVNKNKRIITIDDSFKYGELNELYKICAFAPYVIKHSGSPTPQNLPDKRLICLEEDFSFIKPNILDVVFNSEERSNKLKEYGEECRQIYINCGIVTDLHMIHVDKWKDDDGMTCLIYAKNEWDQNWGGETVFYDDLKENIVFTNSYVPGRIILFDSNIPHCARPQSLCGPSFRFTIAIKFLPINKS